MAHDRNVTIPRGQDSCLGVSRVVVGRSTMDQTDVIKTICGAIVGACNRHIGSCDLSINVGTGVKGRLGCDIFLFLLYQTVGTL